MKRFLYFIFTFIFICACGVFIFFASGFTWGTYQCGMTAGLTILVAIVIGGAVADICS